MDWAKAKGPARITRTGPSRGQFGGCGRLDQRRVPAVCGGQESHFFPAVASLLASTTLEHERLEYRDSEERVLTVA